MNAFLIFMIAWVVFSLLGIIGSVGMHINLSAQEITLIMLQHDLVLILVIAYILAALVVLYILNKPKNEETKK